MPIVSGGGWRRTPPVTARLDPRHPWCHNLVGLMAGSIIFAGGPKHAPPLVVSPTRGTRYGTGRQWSSGTATPLCAMPVMSDTTDLTVAAVGVPFSVNQFVIGYGNADGALTSGGDGSEFLIAPTGFTWHDAAFSHTASLGPGAAAQFTDQPVVFVKQGLVITLYYQSAAGLVILTTTVGAGVLHESGCQVFVSLGATSFAAVWNQAFTEREVVSLIGDPFQMFET